MYEHALRHPDHGRLPAVQTATRGLFCDLPKPSLEELEKVKYASAYPQGAVLFVEGRHRGAST